MANKVSTKPFDFVTPRAYEAIRKGGDFKAPAVSYEEHSETLLPRYDNLQGGTPAPVELVDTSLLGLTNRAELEELQTEEGLAKFVETEQRLMQAFLPELSRGENVEGLGKRIMKMPATFTEAASETIANIGHNLASIPTSVNRNAEENYWNVYKKGLSQETKNEMLEVNKFLGGNAQRDLLYADVDTLEEKSGLLLSDETKDALREYQQLLRARKADERWMQVKQVFSENWNEEGLSEHPFKLFANVHVDNSDWRGNEDQWAHKIAEIGGSTAASALVFYGAGLGMGNMMNVASKVLPGVQAAAGVMGKATTFGLSAGNQYAELRNEALLNGMSINEANTIGLLGGLVEGGLELAGMNCYKRFLKSDRTFRNILFSAAFPEGTQEAFQTAGENIVAELSGLRDRDLEDIISEIAISFAGGAFGGIGMGAVQSKLTSIMSGGKSRGWVEQLNAEARAEEERRAVEAITKDGQDDGGEPPAAGAGAASMPEAKKEALSKVRAEAISKAKEAYYEEAKKVNPKITKEQLDWGWRVTESVLNAEISDGLVSEKLDQASQSVISYFSKVKNVKAKNIEELKKEFSGLKLPQKVQDDLFSGDAFKQNDAMWELLQEQITNDIVSAGGSKSQGFVMGRFLRGLFYNATLLDPDLTPAILYKSIKPTIVSLDRANWHGQSVEGMGYALSGVKKKNINASNISEIQSSAYALAEKIAQESENALPQINQELFGKSDVFDSLLDLKAALGKRAKMEKQVFREMGLTHQKNITPLDYAAIAIMRLQGATQEEINMAYGLTPAEGTDANSSFEQASNKLFPKLKREEMYKLKKLVKDMGKNASEDSMIEGAYSPEQNTAIVSTPESVLHEGVHAGITSAEKAIEKPKNVKSKKVETKMGKKLKDANKLSQYGLIAQKGSISKVLNRLRELTAVKGLKLTEGQFQETIEEALNDFFLTGKTSDYQLTEALNEMKAEMDMEYLHPLGSQYNQLKQQQQKDLRGALQGLLEKSVPSKMLSSADELEKSIYTLEGDELKAKATEFLNNNDIVGKDAFAAMLFAINDPLRVAFLVNDIVTAAKRTSLELLFAEEYEMTENEDGSRTYSRIKADESVSDGNVYYSAIALPMPKEDKLWSPTPWKEQGKKFLTSTFGLKQIKQVWNKLAVSFLDAGYKVHESVGALILQEDYNRLVRNVELQNKIGEFKQELLKNKITEKNYNKFKLLALSCTKKSIKQTAEFLEANVSKKAADAFVELHQQVIILGKELRKVGIELNLVDGYMPSIVINHEGMKQAIFNRGPESEIARKLRKLEQEGASKEQIINAINGELLGAGKDGYHIAAFNHRTILERTEEMMPFYEDPIIAMSKYVEAATRTIMNRHLYGYQLKEGKQFKENSDEMPVLSEVGKLGMLIYDLQKKGVLKDKAEALDFFKKASIGFTSGSLLEIDMIDSIRKLSQGLTLGQVTRVTTQFKELATVVARFGPKTTFDAFKEVLESKGIKIDEDLGITALDEHLTLLSDSDFVARLTDFAYKYSGFAWADAINKNIAINAAAKSNKEIMQKKDTESVEHKQLMLDIQRVFPDGVYTAEQQAEAYKQIENGELGYYNKLFLTYQLGQTQPILSSMMPPMYFSGSFGRLLYSYKTVPLRQLTWLFQWVADGHSIGGSKEATRRVAKIAAFSALIGIPVGILTALLTNRQPDLWKEIKFSPLQMFMINEFTIDILKKEGLWTAIKDTAIPSVNIINDASKTIVKFALDGELSMLMVRNVPIIGVTFFNLLAEGAKQNKKQKRELLETPMFDEEAMEQVENSYNMLRG